MMYYLHWGIGIAALYGAIYLAARVAAMGFFAEKMAYMKRAVKELG